MQDFPSDVTWDAPASLPAAPQPSSDDIKWDRPSGLAAQTLTGLQEGVGYALAAPHLLAGMAESGLGKVGMGPGSSSLGDVAHWAASNTWTPKDWIDYLYRGPLSQSLNRVLGLPQPQPAAATTPEEKIYQTALSTVVPTAASLAMGGAGAANIFPAMTGGLASGVASETAHQLWPDNYWAQLAAGLAGAFAGNRLAGGLQSGVGAGAGAISRWRDPVTAANQQVPNEIAASPSQMLTADSVQNIIDSALRSTGGGHGGGAGGLLGGGAGVLLEHGAEALGVPPGISSLGGHYLGNLLGSCWAPL